MKIRTLLSIITACFVWATGSSAQQLVEYGYCQEADLGNWGTGKAETYNLAIKIDNPALQGLRVKAFKIAMNPEVTQTSGHEAFLCHKLALKSGKAVADICTTAFTPKEEWTTVELNQPYTIDNRPFYAGMTFKVDTLNSTNRKPVTIAYTEHPNGFMLATSRTYRSWIDNSDQFSYVVPIILILEGDIPASAALPIQLEDVRLQQSATGKTMATIANIGTTTIENLDYRFEVEGLQTTGHVEFSPTIPTNVFAATQDFEIDVPSIDKMGSFKGQLYIEKVNGEVNSKATVPLCNQVHILKFVPKHRAVMEEFTGTWCQYCPRGWVGMEMMKERYPNEFIALSYHSGDIMEITDMFPVAVSGFPSSCIDRGLSIDPYYGSSNTNFGIEQDWLERCKTPAPADITVTAQYNEDRSRISITSQTYFSEAATDHSYRIAYSVTADGLKGEGPAWMQSNAFSGMRNPGDLEFFANSPSKVSIEFNDVVIAQTDYHGIEGSLPAQIPANKRITHQHEFAIADMVSNMKNISLVQDYNKINVIALIINNKTQRIENACKCRVNGAETAIEAINHTQPTITARYNLSGLRVGPDYKGVTIIRMSDGKVKKAIQQ